MRRILPLLFLPAFAHAATLTVTSTGDDAADPATLRRMGAAARAAFEASDCVPSRNLERLLALFDRARRCAWYRFVSTAFFLLVAAAAVAVTVRRGSVISCSA